MLLLQNWLIVKVEHKVSKNEKRLLFRAET